MTFWCGSGDGKREGSGAGFVTLTDVSGSGRPKNMRIRIPNTAEMEEAGVGECDDINHPL